ncbi:MAG: hypothetical protein JJE17_12705 [Peptostreptococcaceae bacterium]|nr:hypothetical protein [Peptostreptococcaceae bacterium]
MRKLKRAYIVKLICLFVIILIFGTLAAYFYRIGYFPIIGNKIAEKKLAEYTNTQMQNPQPIKTQFDWYNGRYVCDLNNGSTLSYRLQHNTIHDEAVSVQVNLEADMDYNSVVGQFPANLELPNSITVWTTMNADDYTIKSQRLYLSGIYNTEKLTEEESQKMPTSIAQDFIDLMGSEYNFTGIQLIYADNNGMYEIAIPADTFEPLGDQELLYHTRKFSEEKLPLDYLEWLEQQ